MKRRLRAYAPGLIGVPVAILYAILTRWAFRWDDTSGLWSAMSCGFLFFVPFAMGALTAYLAPRERRTSRAYVTTIPWISCLVAVIVIGLMGLEETVCIIMALPIFLPMSSLGGLFFHIRPAQPEKGASALGLLLILPFLITPIETRLPKSDAVRVVANQIVINADVDTVWENIIRVPLITGDEQHFSVFHLIGLPKPLEATLSFEGVGGVRHASFEDDLVFIETITAWEDHRSLSFTIDRDKQKELPPPLNQIGGPYFGVLSGSYRIEPLANGQILLHLSSDHRLSTRFNPYGRLWTDAVMSNLQAYILEVIKERCEAASPVG